MTSEAVKHWIYRRRLPATKLANGYWKVRVSDFEAYLRGFEEAAVRAILVAGLDDDAQTVATKAIESLGCRVVVGFNYIDALLKAADEGPAMFVIGLSKDDSTRQLAEKIRATHTLRGVPILLVSDAKPTDAEAQWALTIGAQGMLTRPFKSETLAKEMGRLLHKK